MDTSRLIASLAGPTLVALGVTEAMNMHIFEAQTAPVVYLNGLVVFVAGLSLVRFHNVWVLGWPLLITLMGWILLAAGMFRMALPEAQQATATPATYVMLGAITLVGIVLTIAGYRPRRADTA